MIEHFRETLSFIEENQNLVDCHLVDFITKNLWNKCLSDSLRYELESTEFFDEKYDFKKLTNISKELETFVKRADSLSLKNNRSIMTLDDFTTSVAQTEFTKDSDNEKSLNFMSKKKQHEIKVLARLIGHLARVNETTLIIDAGAGKGYLSTCISENYEIPVLAIDSSETNVKGAINRREMILKKKNEKHDLVRYIVQHIDEKTDYKNIAQTQFVDWKITNNCILTGLHTCGQLAHSMIRHFLSIDCIKCLCVVPCCYHLTNETLTGDCNLTKNARMLAQQSVERSESKETDVSHSPSLFYRALLQVILHSLDIPDTRIGRGAPTRDFPSYAHWALTKIGVDRARIPSIETLLQLHRTHSRSQWKFNVFQSMRIHLGSVVEAAIVLDRVIYMRTNDNCSKVSLIKLFDPLISPRCYAIVAFK